VAITAAPRTRTMRAFAAACLGLTAPLLVAGCSTAPAGATSDSPVIGPAQAASPSVLPTIQMPATWTGYRATVYREILWSVSGKKPRSLHIPAGPDLVFWLACLGAGRAMLKSQALGLDWSIPCGPRLDPQSVNFSPTTAITAGRKVLVVVSATPGASWEVRVDAPARPAHAKSGRRPAGAVPPPAARDPLRLEPTPAEPSRPLTPDSRENSGAERARQTGRTGPGTTSGTRRRR
jgi:hypothetical protein